MFLHFALAFPEEQDTSRRHKWFIGLIYVPAFIVVGLQLAAIELWTATQQLNHRLDQIATAYLAIYYVLAALLFFISYRRTDIPLRRQQLKWLTRGTVLAVSPFALLYVVPFLMDVPVPAMLKNIAVASPGVFAADLQLGNRSLSLDGRRPDLQAWRDLHAGNGWNCRPLLRRGGLAAEVVHTRFPSLRVWGLIIAIIVTAQLFRPVKARHSGMGRPCI